MGNLTLTQDYIQELSAKTGFKDNGDVDFQNSVLYVDDNDSLLYIDNDSSYCNLYNLLSNFLSHLLPFKILWCNNSEYTSEELLKRLGFQYHINGITNTYYIMIN